MPAMELQHRQVAMADRRQRLDQLSQMLEGLAHLEPAASLRLDARIGELESELHRLAEAVPHGATS
jgi:hypothetical protein